MQKILVCPEMLLFKTFEVYLGHAYVDYESSYGSAFGEDPQTFSIERLEALIKKVNPSKKLKNI